MKTIPLDMVRVTEAAAIAASRWVGRGDKYSADKAATDAMAIRLCKIDFAGRIVIGEGAKDNAPMLSKGDCFGNHWGNKVDPEKVFDIAVDPLDGTTQTAKGGYEAMSVLAVGEEGSLLDTEGWYMKKLAFGPKIKEHNLIISLYETAYDIVNRVAVSLKKDVNHTTVCILDRPRHESLIAELRKTGCRIKFIQDCDVSAAIATAIPESGIDLYMGVGGAPEGVIGAAALKCLGGDFQGIICDKEGKAVDNKIYYINDLAKGDVIFCATGVTDGSLLKGVRWTTSSGPITHSLLMRSESGTIRWIETQHGN